MSYHTIPEALAQSCVFCQSGLISMFLVLKQSKSDETVISYSSENSSRTPQWNDLMMGLFGSDFADSKSLLDP